jgi:hypothetical protein
LALATRLFPQLLFLPRTTPFFSFTSTSFFPTRIAAHPPRHSLQQPRTTPRYSANSAKAGYSTAFASILRVGSGSRQKKLPQLITSSSDPIPCAGLRITWCRLLESIPLVNRKGLKILWLQKKTPRLSPLSELKLVLARARRVGKLVQCTGPCGATWSSSQRLPVAIGCIALLLGTNGLRPLVCTLGFC